MNTDQYSTTSRLRYSADLFLYYRTVRSYLKHFSRPWCTTDDLVQETYAEAYGTIRNRGPPDKPVPWLLAIATRTAYRVLSSERSHHSYLLEDVIDDHTLDPPGQLLAQEELALLRRTLRKLSASDRDLLAGFYMKEMSCAELGRAYDFSPGAAKTRLHRARQRLKKHYSITDNGSGGAST